MDSALYWIWLQSIFGYGTTRSETVLKAFPSPAKLFEASADGPKEKHLFTARELELLDRRDLEWAQEVAADCTRRGIAVLTPEDPNYPQALHNIYSKPSALYVTGDISCLSGRLAIAMVGARHCTTYGKQAADRLARELVSCGAAVVSGLAQGIDTISHTGALKGGGKTVAVLGCGHDQDYPVSNRTLRRLIEQHGAVVSEYPPGTKPLSRNFPIRNRIISGLSAGIVVVEGARRSGSLITAGHALAQGRDVFAVPGSIFSESSTGPHWLIRQGAIPVTCTRDILEEYLHLSLDTINTGAVENLPLNAWEAPEKQTESMIDIVGKNTAAVPCKRQAPPSFLTDKQRTVYAAVGNDPQNVDSLTVQSGLEVREVLSALTQLEIYGLIKALPGRRYTIYPE